MGKGDDMTNHVNEIKTISEHLEAIGDPIVRKRDTQLETVIKKSVMILKKRKVIYLINIKKMNIMPHYLKLH